MTAGSCLYPQADEDIMNSVLEKPSEMDFRIFEIPTSAIMINGKKIKYFDFISSVQNEDCNRALLRILRCIDMERIGQIINETPFISDLQRRFYLAMLTERKKRILDYSAGLLNKKVRK